MFHVTVGLDQELAMPKVSKHCYINMTELLHTSLSVQPHKDHSAFCAGLLHADLFPVPVQVLRSRGPRLFCNNTGLQLHHRERHERSLLQRGL